MLTCADSGHRRDVVVSTARRHGWSSARGALTAACECGARPGAWCVRRGRPVVGYVHPSRTGVPAEDMIVPPGENVSLELPLARPGQG